MGESPTVTIITPTYNAERHIARCLQSALDQTFTDWEQIVVDDGSTDRTAEIVRAFGDPRIRLIELPHRGLAALAETYNTALGVARGELIGVLEGDDVWLPSKLALQVPAFTDRQVVLSWGRALVVDAMDRVQRRWAIPRAARRDFELPELFRLLARWNVLSPAVTVMVRRAALEQVGGFQQGGSSLYVDLPTWLAVTSLAAGTARFIDEDIAWYRISGSNTGTVHNSTMRLEHQVVVTERLRALTPAQLQALGWNARDQRAARASASLTEGIAYHQLRDRVRARSAFARALRQTRSPREVLTASIGYAAAASGIDLIALVQKLRMTAASWALQISR